MKTAISIPDVIFKSAERLAHRLGMSRSQLYVVALRSFLERKQRENVTQKLNEIYGEANDTIDPSLQSMQARSLPKTSW